MKIFRLVSCMIAALLVATAGGLLSGCAGPGPNRQPTPASGTNGNPMTFAPIGIVHSPFTPATGAPRQGRLDPDAPSQIVMDPRYEPGLKDLETFSNIYVIYAFNRSEGWHELVRTPWQTEKHGVFATRSPNRPNPIGLTVVKLVRREGAVLHVTGLDAYDGTPVLDLKPYIPKFDCIQGANQGWLGEAKDSK